MSTRELIEREIAALPEAQQREVYEYVVFLRSQSARDPFDGLLVSEAALAKEWITPEEEAAWANS